MLLQFIFEFILPAHYFEPKENVVICFDGNGKEIFARLLDYVTRPSRQWCKIFQNVYQTDYHLKDHGKNKVSTVWLL